MRTAADASLRIEPATINGEAAVVTGVQGRIETVFVCSIDADASVALRAIRNPETLRFLQRQLDQE